MIHSLEPTIANLHGHYSRDLKPILTIASGDTIRYKTLDAGWSEMEQPNPYEKPIKVKGRDRERDPGHALVGPVAVDGGLFSIGDGHAIQGDGEVGNVALECPMELVEVEFYLHPDLRIDFPRAYTSTDWITFGFHEDLDEATMIALDSMLGFNGGEIQS